MREEPKSVYRRGAEDGLILGPVLALAVVFTGITTYAPWAFIPAVMCLVAVPSVCYVLLRRSFDDQMRCATMSALWLEGICAFFFGGLIMALVAYVGMRWLHPSFIADQFRTVIAAYSTLDNPDAANIAATLQKAVDARALPTPIELALELLYAAVFSGSILSAILALIIRRRK